MTSQLPIYSRDDNCAVITRRLTKTYGGKVALQDVELRVPSEAVFLLLGPNGAGKSTAIGILMDITQPTSGEVEVLGVNPQRDAAEVRARVGYVPEQLEWGYGWMTVGRVLIHHSRYFPCWDWKYANSLMHRFDLQERQKMRTLSKGQGRRVHLVLALAHRPPVLILDEPTDGLDPIMRDDTLAVLANHLHETRATMILCTHHAGEFDNLATYVGVLQNGRLRTQMPMEDLRSGMKRYRAQVPPGWRGEKALSVHALRGNTSDSMFDWIIWGSEPDILAALHESGAVSCEALPVSLNEATLALLNRTSDQ